MPKRKPCAKVTPSKTARQQTTEIERALRNDDMTP